MYLNVWSKSTSEEIELPSGNWSYVIDGDEAIECSIDGSIATITSIKTGMSHITFTNDNNEVIEYYINVSGNEMYISKFD